MNCPKCGSENYSPSSPCEECHFHGDVAAVEEFLHVNWLLGEMETWGKLPFRGMGQDCIQNIYTKRKRDLEVDLGLRPPLFSDEEALGGWMEIFRAKRLLRRLKQWGDEEVLHEGEAQTLRNSLTAKIDENRQRLGDRPHPTAIDDTDRLKAVDFILENAEKLAREEVFASPEAAKNILKGLEREKEVLEVELGLREPTSTTPPLGTSTPQQVSAKPHAPSTSTKPDDLPHIPLSQRLRRALLSERTLHGILFLGIFLLFAAAISFVVWGWRDFSPLMRVSIPAGFTAMFFGLGWFVRSKTPLYRSGIALSAIAALLVPIDAYTVYANFGFQPRYWAEFWQITSLVCLVVYVISSLMIQNQFFGYLVVTAAGSLTMASMEVMGLSQDWYSAGLMGLGIGLVFVADALRICSESSRWRIFMRPFRVMALLAAGVLLPLTFGWRFVDRATYDTLHAALTFNWWMGSFIIAWATIHYRSRTLGFLTALSLPVTVYLTQAPIFNDANVHPAWHAFGWACLTLVYFVIGHRLKTRYAEDALLRDHGKNASRWGGIMLGVATLWPFMDITGGEAVAASHVVLVVAVILATIFWRRPWFLYGASLLSFSAITFSLTAFNFTLVQASVGWVTLSLLLIVTAFNVGNRLPGAKAKFALPLVLSGYWIAALALLPAFFPYHGDRLAYLLGNWLGLTAWGAYLAHRGQPGFKKVGLFWHWAGAFPLPFWVWVLFTNRRPADFSLALALAVLSWGMVFLGHKLASLERKYRHPWRLLGLVLSVGAPIAAWLISSQQYTLPLTILLAGLLYFADAFTMQQNVGLFPAGIVSAWGLMFLLSRADIGLDQRVFILSLVVVFYLFFGLWTERRKSKTGKFLTPLYLGAHLLTARILFTIVFRPLTIALDYGVEYTDDIRLWGAATLICLGMVYLLYAWGRNQKFWAHAGIWMGVFGGGLVVSVLSQGTGLSAALASLAAVLLVLLERGLYTLRQHHRLSHRQRVLARLASWVYRQPLLFGGWVISVGTIFLALGRNLVILEDGRLQQIWSVVALTMITALYALSTYLFRKRIFALFASLLVFAPWTILTDLGWFTPYRLSPAGFSASWMVLVWALYGVSRWVQRASGRQYAFPIKIVTHLLAGFSLFWAFTDPEASRYTFGFAFVFYAFAAWVQHREYLSFDFAHLEKRFSFLYKTKYLYPASVLFPLWGLYLLALMPGASREHYGLFLLVLASLGLASGRWLRKVAPRSEIRWAYAFPAYLVAYVSLVAGTILVSESTGLLSIALLYDALLLLVSTWIFRHPAWVVPSLALMPASLLLALDVAHISEDRWGWWLMGLSALYLAAAWLLRRVTLRSYSIAPIVAALVLTALGLVPSSADQIAALWGYAAAALLYTLVAFWLERPVLLTPAAAFVIVPYAIVLDRSALAVDYHGLMLLPGAAFALFGGWFLDRARGVWEDFPWTAPQRWPRALWARWLGWWGLPLYALGFGLATSSPFFTHGRSDLAALNLFLLVGFYGWGIYRFRLRFWLLAATLSAHLGALLAIDALGWWQYQPDVGRLLFTPVTLLAASLALWLESRLNEKSPFTPGKFFSGWSRPLYLFVFFDILISQLDLSCETMASVWVTIIHALLLLGLASVWRTPWIIYFSTALGALALYFWSGVLNAPIESLLIYFSYLALGYGVIGYGVHGYKNAKKTPVWALTWRLPMQRSGIALSFGVLLFTFVFGFDIASWTARALFGMPFREIVSLPTVQMLVGVFSLLGLLYLADALSYRRLRQGYVAIGMFLAGWVIFAFYAQAWDGLRHTQWYALPAGVYLLGVSALEWRTGNKRLARGLDYAAIFLLLGSLFWQTLLLGWKFALMLGAEGLLIFFMGSARRLRRFFYAGILAVVLATVGQLINALQAINQWITFGVVGLLLVGVAILVERNLDDIKVWQESLNDWE